MDAGVRSPLIDFFRRGEVASDVRLLAARGALAPRAQEQLALLLLLVDDPDPVVASTAARTVDALPPPAVAAFLARRDAPQAMRDFFAARGIVSGPRKCRMAVRRFKVRKEAGLPAEETRFVPLKATGVISSPLSGKSTEQSNVEAR